MILLKDFRDQYQDKLIAWRRYLHAHPELSWEEHNTTRYIKDQLNSMGIHEMDQPLKTGLVATIRGKRSGERCIALRADMDALPITEQNECQYKSLNEGVMHACGHDVHTTCLLGAADYLMKIQSEWGGTIKLIFQPSEERQPSGAEAIIQAGSLESPKVESILGLHVTPELDCGKLGFRKGAFMASADEIYITVIGKGGHGASPHLCIDPIVISANIILSLQQLVSRNADPKIPTVLSFGDIHGHGATNIIPEKVELKGTLRTFDEVWRREMHYKIKRISEAIAMGFGARAEVQIPEGIPVVYNDEDLTADMIREAGKLIGEINIVEMPLRMGAEDFSYYGRHCPATFYRLGTGSASKNTQISVHNPCFDIDEDALCVGAYTLAGLAVHLLSN